MKNKLFIKISAGILAFILILGVIAMILLIPRTTKAPNIDTWLGEESYNNEKVIKLEKEKGKDFSILALADLQFDVPTKSKKQVKEEISKMISHTDPDLILTVGDNFAGIFNHFHVDAFVKLMDSFGIPWAHIYGNHERDFGADLYYLAKRMQKSELCLFDIGPTNIDGVGNYVMNIVQDDSIVHSLIMMDCNEEIYKIDENGKKATAYYESPRYSQVEWYEDNINAISEIAKKTVPSSIYTHVPIPEFKTAYELYKNNSEEVEYIYGEGVVEGGLINYGLFDRVLELDSTKHMFFGHEHTNYLALNYKGVDFAYVNKTGNFSSHNEGKTGGTHIIIDDNGNLKYTNLFASQL